MRLMDDLDERIRVALSELGILPLTQDMSL